MEDELGLPSGAFAKLDAEEDELFYEPPRLVQHIDDGAIAALTGLYRAVLRDVRRVLRPGAPLVVSFSNRCFWTKAVAVWRSLNDAGHAQLVEAYLRHAGFAAIETRVLAEWVEDVSDPMIAVIGRAP